MVKLYLTVIILLLVPIAYASFNCSLTSNPQECNNLLSENISQEQQDQLLANIVYNYTNFPDHNFILQYNSQIKVNSSIENLSIKNSTYIKNAWVSLLVIMPSVLENNILYVPSNTFALSDYNYNLIIPQNYVSNNYPNTLNGNCKTTYTLNQNNSILNIKVNSQVQGNNKLQSITVNQNSTITSELSANIQIKQDNYRWQRYCSSYRRGICVQYNFKCSYSNTNYLNDNVDIQDSINVSYYNKEPYAEAKVIDSYYNTTQVQFNAFNYSNLAINFQNSNYNEKLYIYDVVFSKKPFYFITLEAHKANIKNINALLVGYNNTLYINNINGCSITASNFFYSSNFNCNLTSVNKTKEPLATYIPFSYDLTYFLKVALLIFILYVIYRIIRHFVIRFI